MKLKSFFFCAAAGIMVAACSNEVNEQLSTDNQRKLTTIYSGSDKFSTRSVSDSKWENGNQIGVYMVNSDGTQINTESENVMFTTTLDASSTSATFTSTTGIPLLNEIDVNVFAYYPYSDTKVADNYIYNVDVEEQSTESAFEACDLRWGKTAAAVSTSSLTSGLSLTFAHQLSLLKVKVNVDADRVSVSGVNSAATFDMTTGTLTPATEQTAIELYQVDAQNYMAVVVPTESISGNLVLTITEGANTYKYTYTATTDQPTSFDKGCSYSFAITLAGTGSTLNSITASMENTWDDTTITGTSEEPTSLAPEGYEGILVGAETNLGTTLEGLAAGKKYCILFTEASAESYTISDATIPTGVTGLYFYNTTSDLQVINIGALNLPSDESLAELKFENVEVIGDGNNQLISADGEMASGGVVEIKGCYFHDMENIFYGTADNIGNTLVSLTITDSRIGNAGNLFNGYKVTSVNISQSTIYNMDRVINASNSGITVDIQNCTFYNTSGTPLETTVSSSSNSLIYKNNLSACYRSTSTVNTNDVGNSNIAYRMSTSEENFSGNYAASGYSSGSRYYLPLVRVGGSEVTYTNAWLSGSATAAVEGESTAYTFTGTAYGDIFEDADNGDFTLKTTFTYQVGDPRWYTTE